MQVKVYNAPFFPSGRQQLKLSKRLKQIEQMVGNGYDHIWDCCCDHGLLGIALLERQAAPHIHFVDIVPELISNVEAKLQKFDSKTQSHWQVHCLDTAAIPFDHYHGKHLVIIAGVGGDLISMFVNAILKQHPNLNIEFIVCPVHHQFALRETFRCLQQGLVDEALIKENGRFYEIIHVDNRQAQQKPINLVGEKFWQATSTEGIESAKEYLKKTLVHYQKIQQGQKKNVDHIVDAYQAITI
ncbi:tRNA (adenine(22)-N(1))-methyltransferase [Vibrio fluminensis]|uniref:tRNA (adenine(22)-N(1))-methyltransferase n=1 Tax=Vibrio fluminensis TaxID=2783614 RepID=UPI001E5FB781|nr:tRNA (adenine(22)-N(1))-methyltransferase TrmK [Vibrio fluminensis]